MEDKLKQRVIKFFKDNHVECEETISQTDRVIENAYGFLEDLFNIVKDDLNEALTNDENSTPHIDNRVGFYYDYKHITEWIGDGDYLYKTGSGVMLMSEDDSQKLINEYYDYLEDIKNINYNEDELYDRQEQLRDIIWQTLSQTFQNKRYNFTYKLEELVTCLWDSEISEYKFGTDEFMLEKIIEPKYYTGSEFKIYTVGLALYNESAEYDECEKGCTR